MTDVTELRAKKLTLENEIVDLIRKFELETGLSVDDTITLSRSAAFSISNGDIAVTYKANVTATIP